MNSIIKQEPGKELFYLTQDETYVLEKDYSYFRPAMQYSLHEGDCVRYEDSHGTLAHFTILNAAGIPVGSFTMDNNDVFIYLKRKNANSLKGESL